MTDPSRGTHGAARGANLSRSSRFFEGAFGRIFRALPPAEFGANDERTVEALHKLARQMTSARDPADPKVGPDNEESGIPAAYTYFGQFIDHDLTFDPASSLQKQNDPDGLVDYRTPRFDLDNVYGRGPDDQPYLYEDGARFILGRALTGAPENPRARDLPRSSPAMAGRPKRAIIGDPRNDENVIVSQLQGLFLRLHNRFVSEGLTFAAAQKKLRFHYQWVLINDFLPKIISAGVLNCVLPHLAKGTNTVAAPPNLRFYHWKNEGFMPLEFSAAAYRFGHSMVRPGYLLNDHPTTLLSIFHGGPNGDLRGFREFPSNWAIDWRLFIDLAPMNWADPNAANVNDVNSPFSRRRTQLAYKIDTALVNPIGHLPPEVASHPAVLAERNLLRGWRMRLPSGQDVARAMGLTPLDDADIRIGKFTGDTGDIIGPITSIDAAFAGNCPLWTYVLAETVEETVTIPTLQGDQTVTSRKLGPVGGRIVAETFVGLLLADSSSYLSQDPLWTPDGALTKCGKFGLRELIAAALAA